MPHSQPSRPSTANDPGADPKLSGGRLLSAISNSIAALRREHYGRGPMKAKTYVLDDIIIVVMRENGYSAIEKTMIDNDEAERVIALREDFQRVMAKRYSDTIEILTGRSVVAFLNRAHLHAAAATAAADPPWPTPPGLVVDGARGSRSRSSQQSAVSHAAPIHTLGSRRAAERSRREQRCRSR